MPAWTPILVQKIEIQALGFLLQKLQLNRHNPAEVPLHRHAHAQLILYLAGEALQRVGKRTRVARAGDLFIIPPQAWHGSAVPRRNLPLCLVLDFQLDQGSALRATRRHVSPERLNELHALLAGIPSKGRLTLFDYSAILGIVARLLADRPMPGNDRSATLFSQIQPMLQAGVPLPKIARSAGCHPDHLTRKLKRETGLGLRALRDRTRLAAAQSALRTTATVAEAATRCGFEDPNYFSRWFRRKAGRTPATWKSQPQRGSGP